MPDELPTIPALQSDYLLEVCPALHNWIRECMNKRGAQGYELVQLVLSSSPLEITDEAFKSARSNEKVVLIFRRSNLDAQAAVLREIAALVQARLNEISIYRQTVAAEINGSVQALRGDVRKAIEGPITEVVKQSLEERLLKIEGQLEELRGT